MFKELRIAANLTQKELAEVAGVNVRQIQKLEYGEISMGNITLINAVALADALGIDDLRVLLGRVNND